MVGYHSVEIAFNVLDARWYRLGDKRKEEILEKVICSGFILNMVTNNNTDKLPILAENTICPFDPLCMVFRICTR